MYIDEKLIKILKPHIGETIDVSYAISLIKTIAKEYETKQCDIPIVSTRFELGKRVKIDRCIYGHNFEIGQTVEIVDHEASQTTSWLCTDGTNSWWLSEEEGNVC